MPKVISTYTYLKFGNNAFEFFIGTILLFNLKITNTREKNIVQPLISDLGRYNTI